MRYVPQPREDESALTTAVARLASQYGRYGYRRIHALLRAEAWHVSHSPEVVLPKEISEAMEKGQKAA